MKVSNNGQRKVFVIMQGRNLNHENKKFNVKVSTHEDVAKKLIDELKFSTQEQDITEEERGDDYATLTTDKSYVYIIWLSEMSRIYAGNEIMYTSDDEVDAKYIFHAIWAHQTERWNFDSEITEGDTEEPTLDFQESGLYMFWRNNCDDCQQVIGIAKLDISSDVPYLEWEDCA